MLRFLKEKNLIFLEKVVATRAIIRRILYLPLPPLLKVFLNQHSFPPQRKWSHENLQNAGLLLTAKREENSNINFYEKQLTKVF